MLVHILCISVLACLMGIVRTMNDNTEMRTRNQKMNKIIGEWASKPIARKVRRIRRAGNKLEKEALNHILGFANATAASRDRPFLSAMFLNASVSMQNAPSMEEVRRGIRRHPLVMLSSNMALTKGICDWAVISYSCGQSNQENVQHIAESSGVKLAHYACASPWAYPANYEPGDLIVAKPFMYPLLLDVLPFYKKVWLLDDDISLASCDVSRFLHVWGCGFFPREAPLVVQPTISPSTQRYEIFNADFWANSSTIASDSRFIEVQAPAFEGAFLHWLVKHVAVPMQPFFFAMRSDWGFDELFCRSAAFFQLENVRPIGNKVDWGTSGRAHPYRACAIITDHRTQVTHHQYRTLAKTLNYTERGFIMSAQIKANFPRLARHGFNKRADSDALYHPQQTVWERVWTLPQRAPQGGC